MKNSRTLIRDNVRDRLEQLFGKPAGSVLPKVRSIKSGQWVQSNQLPCLTVTGAEQGSAGGSNDSENEKTVEYGIEILLELKENWDSGSKYNEWEEFVQALIEALWNWLPVAGAMRMDYAGDDNPDVQLTFGPDVSMWVIRFRCTYCVDVGIIGKAD